MKSIGFINSKAPTGTTVRQAGVAVYLKPRNEADPSVEGDMIVILHVSQPNDHGSKPTTEYACFSACVASLCAGDVSNPDYPQHQSWIAAHADRIVGVVLTSGGAINEANERFFEAANRLRTERPWIGFQALPVDTLVHIIQEADLDLFLRGRLCEEVAHQFLLTCQCYLWQRLQPYTGSVELASEESAVRSFEQEVLARLAHFSNEWTYRREIDLIKIKMPEFDARFEQLAEAASQRDTESYLETLATFKAALFTELDDDLDAHIGVHEQIRSELHELVKLLNRGLNREAIGLDLPQTALVRAQLDVACKRARTDGLGSVADSLAAMSVMLPAAQGAPQTTVRALLGQLDTLYRTLEPVPALSSVASAVFPEHPPAGYETILLADDEQVPPEFMAVLEKRGYYVAVIDSYRETESTLDADPHAVFVCDQTFGEDSSAGRRLMSLASQQPACRLIVALSGSRLEASEVPEAHAVCAGPNARTEQGAHNLHEVIWQWATR